MFRPSQILQRDIKRLRLTTKMTGKGYYKGNRTGSMGTHNRWGGYILDPKKVRTYKVPADLKDFELTPFITENIEKPHHDWRHWDPLFKITGEEYLKRWKEENGGT